MEKQKEKESVSQGFNLLPKNYIVDVPVYFVERSTFYEMFDEIVDVMRETDPLFDPSPEQRHYTIEIMVMGRDLDSLKVSLFFFFKNVN